MRSSELKIRSSGTSVICTGTMRSATIVSRMPRRNRNRMHAKPYAPAALTTTVSNVAGTTTARLLNRLSSMPSRSRTRW